MASRPNPGNRSASATTCGWTAGACASAAARTRRTRRVAYHRPAQEGMRADAKGDAPSSIERLPKVGGQRWIPVSPLAAARRRPRDLRDRWRARGGPDAAGRGDREPVQPAGARRIRRDRRSKRELQEKAVAEGVKGEITVGDRHRRRRQQSLAAGRSHGACGRGTCGRSSKPAVSKPTASCARTTARSRWIARSPGGAAARSPTTNSCHCRSLRRRRALLAVDRLAVDVPAGRAQQVQVGREDRRRVRAGERHPPPETPAGASSCASGPDSGC